MLKNPCLRVSANRCRQATKNTINLLNSLRMKTNFKTIVVIIIFIIAHAIFSDWSNFKAGLMGKPEIENVRK